ncbi:hypothetical protein [Acinetobacter baumannii]|uniref:hypothetical protein n=1 Tax=Acinetobacter baumannii TaxID=470 RepID=UPI001E332B01|nr:hypothetical protein [Acinetobacter baumannii]
MADLPNYQYYLQQSPIIISQDDSAKQAESSARLESIKTLVHEAATRNALRARRLKLIKSFTTQTMYESLILFTTFSV